jgi:sugar phosphate isomerase/epimerase
MLEGKKAKLPLIELPRFTMDEFGLHGLNLQTKFLAGWGLDELDRLRDQADKVGCPWLTLIEEQAQPLGETDEKKLEQALDRLDRVLRVAHRLGCAGVAIGVEHKSSSDEAGLDRVAERLKGVLSAAERLEMNLLLSPRPGLTSTPEQLTGLIRKVGGFRIGSLPDFEAASASGDAAGYLRSLTPYASAVTAAATGFDAKGKHQAFDLSTCVDAIKSVGFEGTLSLEYRGPGDPIQAILATKQVIEQGLEVESS